jgi:hypothetical protein
VDFLREYWATQGVSVEYEVFRFDGPDPPLSWHLSRREKEAIDTEFDLAGDRWMTVRNFLEKARVAEA